jgi:hypothetical protein
VIVIPIGLSFPLDKQKTLASRRGSLRLSVVFALAAPVPPSSSVLPPGAGNKAEKAIQPKKKRAENLEQRRDDEAVSHGELDAAAIARHGDGDSATVPTLELTQCDLLDRRHPAADRDVGAVYASFQGTRNHPNLTPPSSGAMGTNEEDRSHPRATGPGGC